MAVDNLLDLKGGDVFTPAPHKVVFAVDEEEVAVAILIGEIAAPNPASTGFLGRRFRVFIVFGQGRATPWPVDQLAHGSRRKLAVLLVDHLHLEAGTRLAHRANFTCCLGVGVEQETAFSLRIQLNNLDIKTPLKL